MPESFGGPGDERIAKEAAHWHAVMLGPDAEARRVEFEQWRRADPAHAAAYAESERLGALAKQLRRRSPSVAEARRPALLRPALALALLALFVVATLWVGGRPSPAVAEIANPGPAVRAVRLSEGTSILLDAGTAITVSLSNDARRATMVAGRARFNVAADPDHPFSIVAGDARVTAEGGVFDIWFDRGSLRVRPLRGPVEITARGVRHRLDGGGSDGALAFADGRATRIPLPEGAAEWPASRLSFDNVPLADVVALANRLDRPPIRFGDRSVGLLRVTGVFDIRDSHRLARRVAAVFDLAFTEGADALVLSPQSDPAKKIPG